MNQTGLIRRGNRLKLELGNGQRFEGKVHSVFHDPSGTCFVLKTELLETKLFIIDMSQCKNIEEVKSKCH